MSRRIAPMFSFLSVGLSLTAPAAFALPTDVGRTADVFTNAIRYQAAVYPVVDRPRARPETSAVALAASWEPAPFDPTAFAKVDAAYDVSLTAIDLGERWISPFNDDDLFAISLQAIAVPSAQDAAPVVAVVETPVPYLPLDADVVIPDLAAFAAPETEDDAVVVAAAKPALPIATSPVPYLAVEASAKTPTPYVPVEGAGAGPTPYVAVAWGAVTPDAGLAEALASSDADFTFAATERVYPATTTPTGFVPAEASGETPVPYVVVEAGGATPTPYVPVEVITATVAEVLVAEAEEGAATPLEVAALEATSPTFATTTEPTPYVAIQVAALTSDIDPSTASSSRDAASDDSDIMTAMADGDDNLVIRDGGEDGVDTMMMSSDVLFSFGKAELAPAALETLASIGEMADEVPVLQVFGHTDAIGSEANNLTLGQQRAEAVRDWLLANTAFTEDRIIATGIGEVDPVAPNLTEEGVDFPEGRAQNRRVEFAFHEVGFVAE